MFRNFQLHIFHGIPITTSFVVDFDNIQNEIKNALESTTFEPHQEWNSHLLGSPNFNENWLEKHNCEFFKKELREHLELYFKELRLPLFDYFIANSWCTTTLKGQYAHIHNHHVNHLSGVYYYKTNGKDGNLFFESPHVQKSWFLHALGGTYIIPPKEGKLVLFPSWMNHGVGTNTTDSERISLAFDIIFESKPDKDGNVWWNPQLTFK